MANGGTGCGCHRTLWNVLKLRPVAVIIHLSLDLQKYEFQFLVSNIRGDIELGCWLANVVFRNPMGLVSKKKMHKSNIFEVS